MPDVDYWDTAEFQALGPVLGIAHPTGYPAYTLLLWLASVVLQPFGNPAFRADMLSALLVAAACGVVGATVAYLTRRLVVGVGVGIAFAVATQRVGDRPARRPARVPPLPDRAARAPARGRGPTDNEPARQTPTGCSSRAAALFGVSLANHALTLLLAPGVGLYVLLVYPGILRRACG